MDRSANVEDQGPEGLRVVLLVGGLWGLIARNRRLLRPEVSEKEIGVISGATTPNVGFYVGVIVLAILAPRVAAFGYTKKIFREREPSPARARLAPGRASAWRSAPVDG